MKKQISYQISVSAAVSDVWQAWPTEKGAKTFFAPDRKIKLKPSGEGGEWDQAFDYFTRDWGEIVLPRLKYRFEDGPIDWENPPALGRREK